MATASSNPSSIVSAGAWLTTGNVYASDNTYATDTGATQNTEYPFDVGGFNFSGIPAGAAINTVTVTIEAKTSTAARSQIKGELYDGSTLIPGSLALTNLTATDANYTFTPTPTLAQLQSATLKVRVTDKRIVAQASTTSVDYVKIDVNYTPPPLGKMSMLVDTFDTQISGTLWSAYGNVNWSAGQAALTERSGAYSGITTANTYDLTSSSIYVKLTAPPVGAASRETGVAIYKLGDSANNGIWMTVYDVSQKILMRSRVAGVDNANSIAYDPVAHLWFRIGMTGATTINWDTSPDGTTWTNQRSVTTTADFSGVVAEISNGQYAVEGGTLYTAYVDNVNTPPAGTATGRPKVWTGSAWAQKPGRVWTGSGWVEKPWKVWTGSAWKTLT